MEPELFEQTVKNISTRYTEEISKMVISGTPLSPQMMDAIWKKHCTPHVDAMYGMVSNTVQQMLNDIAIQTHNNLAERVSRSTVSEVECTSIAQEDQTIKIIVGLKIGSRYVGHGLGYTIDMVSGNILDRMGNVVNKCKLEVDES